LYRGVEKLLPGHFLIADYSGVHTREYWDIPGEEDPPARQTKSPMNSSRGCANRFGCGWSRMFPLASF
jgi:asparagine synthetase B (glutamine-hydrolysing)